MKALLLLPLLLTFNVPGQNPTSSQEGPSVTVTGFKWSELHQKGKAPDPAQTSPPTPQREMIPANKVWQREARVNDPMGAKDPNEDTLDTRSAALEKLVQESRTPTGKAIDVFEYRVKVQNTSKKAIEILLAEDLEVKILVLPDNSDPDEFIRKSGASEYQRQRGEAQPHIQFVIDQAVRDRNLSNPVDKDAALEEVLPYVYEVKSSIQQHEYFVLVMDRFKVPPSERRRYSQRIREKSGFRSTLSLGARPQAKPTPAETRLVRLLLNDEELRRGILQLLEPEDYEGLATEPIFRVLFELEQEGVPVDFQTVSASLEGLNTSIDLPLLFFSDSLHAEEEEFTAEKCVISFRLMRINRRIDELNASLANAERAKDAEEVARLSIEHVELSKRRSALLPKAEAMQIGN